MIPWKLQAVPDLPVGSRASKFRGPPAKVYNIFNTVIGLAHLYCHNVLLVPDLGQMRPCASYVMRPLTWALIEVETVGLHKQSGIHTQEI